MNHTISLFQEEAELHLEIGRYNLYFLGGFEVLNDGDFIIGIFRLESREQVKFEFANRQRIRINGIPAVKYFSFEISHNGSYSILIQRPNELTIKKSNIPMFNLFQPPVSPRDKLVFIERTEDG